MRRTSLFCETRRQTPADSESGGHALLLRGGYVQPLAAGIFSFLPLGERVRRRVQQIMREEMDAIGGQEVSLPVVQPAGIWQETGRWHQIGPEMVRFRDRGDRDMVLAMTHEEVVGDLLRKQIRSYRQLPVMLYQLQTKFRDEPRARGGLMRVREFTMKDGYSCHVSAEDLDAYYPQVYEAYLRIFRRSGIDVLAVEADVGMMGGSQAHEFMYVNPIGEDQLVLCDQCGYAANRQIAEFSKGVPPHEAPAALEEIATPEITTIAALAEFLGIEPSRTAKAAFFAAGDRLVFAVIRGDMEVNETKLANAVHASELRPANAAELAEAGIVAGYASPIGVGGTTVVVDDLVATSSNLVAGANRPGYHLLNTNYGRDYRDAIVADIASAAEGSACIRCASALRLVRGVEVGNTFKLGTRYSEALGATFLDESASSRTIVMGSYGIGVGRLMACVAEEHHDADGLIWPVSIAPFDAYLVGLDADDAEIRAKTEAVYSALTRAGIATLYDDRDERAGVKFKDADLLGMPLRLTIGRRSLGIGSVELKVRRTGAIESVAVEAISQAAAERLRVLGESEGAATAG